MQSLVIIVVVVDVVVLVVVAVVIVFSKTNIERVYKLGSRTWCFLVHDCKCIHESDIIGQMTKF